MKSVRTSNDIQVNFSDESINQLTELLYQSLEDETGWEPFLLHLSKVLGIKVIHMIAQDKSNHAISFSEHANVSVESEFAYLHKYQFVELRLQHLTDKLPGYWVHDYETVGEEVMAKHPIYQEFLAPADVKYSSICKLVDDERAVVYFGVFTSPMQGPISKECLNFLNKLLPHMCRVCRLSIQNFIYSTQALVGHTLVNKLRQPVILTSVHGEVMHVNESAKQMLKVTDLVSIKEGRLQMPPKYQQIYLNECEVMEIAIKTSSFDETSNFKTLQISSSIDHKTLYAFYTMLPPQRVMRAYGLRPLVMLFFYHPESAPKVDASLLSAAFGLTPAECRIAILLAEGFAQKEIAQRLGLKHDTVRKQLQIIYQKTSTNQQSELIRLMLHLPSNFLQKSAKNLNAD
ncbi:helix-turn-helix transcriptional regulator [Methylophilus sp. 3sh_L]|uniref:helix-turn-helix transcriptional regulator n=1 Tax=Methylophilus sp. 3sh_L TaxID=3377114 RepID=UPI00398EE36F